MDSERQDHLVEERYLDVHEAAELLDVNEQELWELVHQHKVSTHNIAGAFLRFKKEDIEDLKIKWRIERELFPKKQPSFAHESTLGKVTLFDQFKDFLYFNDFYILCSLLIVVLLYFIAASQ